MSKNIFDEAKETLLGVGTTFIAVPCNPIGEENSDMIHLRDSTEEYESEMSKVVKALELGKLYKQLNKLYQELYTSELSQLVLNQNYYEIELIKLKQRIKELENEKDIDKIEKLEKIPMPQISLFDYYKNKKKEKEND